MSNTINALFPTKHDFAQTNIQLLNQLAESSTTTELELIAAAYELACELFGGSFRGSGRTFLAHLVGTASIVADQTDDIELVAAALLHAAYADGQFGFRTGGHQSAHRKRVRDAVGDRVEMLVMHYNEFAWRRSGSIPRLLNTVDQLTQQQRDLSLLRLANELEEYLDLGILHYDNFDELALFSSVYGDTVIELAHRLNYHNLADLLGRAFASVNPASLEAPAEAPAETPASTLGSPPGVSLNLQQSLAWNYRQQVQRQPDKVAVRVADAELTYQALDELSDRLANALIARLGTPRFPVVTLFGHDAGQAVAALGAWKANKIWVPLDALHPETRLRQIVDDSGADLIIHDNTLTELATSISPTQLMHVSMQSLPDADHSQNTELELRPDDPACLIYTSGSTGTPKGVVHSHRTLLHLAKRGSQSLGITSRDRLTLLPSCTQIAGLTDLLRALMNGATLLPFDVRGQSMPALRDWLIAERPTIYHSSATLLRTFSENLSARDCFESVRVVHLGGEAVTSDDVELFKTHFSKRAKLLNNLGCSELSGYRQFFTDSTYSADSGLVPAGYPVEDVEVQICDADGNPAPIGEIGEIVVHSRYLAQGYWQRPEETAKVFEFCPDTGHVRSYRTGDQGYLQHDGCLIYCGREDGQLQVRGHRVDTAEIEAVLSAHPDLKCVAVSAAPSGAKPLVAFLELVSNRAPTIRELRRFVQERLPAYMTPEFTVLPELPLTVNGKIDRAQLKHGAQAVSDPVPLDEVERLHTVKHRKPPTQTATATEQALIQMWEDCLDTSSVQPGDNFFELGGDSLLVIRLLGRIASDFGVTITLREVFGCETLAETATLIVARQTDQLIDASGKLNHAAVESVLTEIEALSEGEADRELEAHQAGLSNR